ncbi:MAG TPA: hypothetical protein VGB95_02400 [Chitinophagales bacterium]
MSKVIGGIFTLIGFICTLGILFLYANSSAYLNYNDPAKHLSFFETGLGVPALLFGLMLTIGLLFMFVSKEPNLK